MFIICPDYAIRTSVDLMKENGFTLRKARSRLYAAQTITDADNTDDIALLGNTPTQAVSLSHSLEQAAGNIGLHMNTDKRKCMRFNDKWRFTETRGQVHLLRKQCLIYWKLHQFGDELRHGQLSKSYRSYGSQTYPLKKTYFFPKERSCQFTIRVHYMNLDKAYRENTRRELLKNATSYIEQMLKATSHQLYGHLLPISKNYSS